MDRWMDTRWGLKSFKAQMADRLGHSPTSYIHFWNTPFKTVILIETLTICAPRPTVKKLANYYPDTYPFELNICLR